MTKRRAVSNPGENKMKRDDNISLLLKRFVNGI